MILDRLYPSRCYDCLAPIGRDDGLCAECRALYAAERRRRDGREGAGAA